MTTLGNGNTVEDNKNLKRERPQDENCVKLGNSNILPSKVDFLYHLNLGYDCSDYLQQTFGDTKFVLMGGTSKRMEQVARFVAKEIGLELPAAEKLRDFSGAGNRYSMFKVGPVICVSHGMGMPSISILLHELIKLMFYAKCREPIFMRLGTCGGIGIEGGNVIITEEALDAQLNNSLQFTIFGQSIRRPTKLDQNLAYELKSMAKENDNFTTVIGKTMCTDDFYEGQARLDGAFCDYTENEKMHYLHQLQASGVVNIEMESAMFAALTHHAGIKAAVVCVSLLNRLKGDQVTQSKETLTEWEDRPPLLACRYIKRVLNCQ